MHPPPSEFEFASDAPMLTNFELNKRQARLKQANLMNNNKIFIFENVDDNDESSNWLLDKINDSLSLI